jgi:nicotinate-nucleotide adenylyltransferase
MMKNPEKLETIIYGGAFNPPTLAHIAILQACVDYARPRGAEVWVMPSGDRSDKTIPTPRVRRLAYIGAMLDDVQSDGVPMSIITDELDRPTEVETYDTVVELADTYPDRRMTWVFGADSTETMGEWKNGDWLLEHLDKIIIERVGSTVNDLAKRATILNVVPPNVSSTEVRRRLTTGEAIDDVVSPGIALLLMA